ncbi:origin recognition complex subunit [Lophiotrema nucula]|uniref:Origin recognition complex subunit n=1 Tax=Lophiotrema nucula TaxID=690887 RepID=A0A6A5ZGE5_9PLEO|nr:origin recognition complex subunit [Lophiotrema nucula]
MEHQRSYIYTPPESDERPAKRQKTDKGHPHSLRRERLQTFREIWAEQETRIQACLKTTLEEADEATQENIVRFVAAAAERDQELRASIPTGLIVAGPSIASHGPYFERLGRQVKESTNSAYLVLTSGESPNLKTLLKNLIKKATSLADDDDDDDLGRTTGPSRNGPRLLDFDLGHLQKWQRSINYRTIVVAIQDSEAFDSHVLSELIDLLHAWLDRLPFVLLFGIATSAESFEDRLSSNALRYLEGEKFDVTQSDEIIEELFSTTIASTDVALRVGPNISRRILDRQKDHVQNVQDFFDGLKYAYMSHFYANLTSIFLRDDLAVKNLPPDVFEAVRNLPSFRRWVGGMLEDGRAQDARNALQSDKYLFDQVTQNVTSGQAILNAISGAALVLTRLRQSLQISQKVPLSSIWIKAASGEMLNSPMLREMMLSVKRMSSDKFLQLLGSLQDLEQTYFPIDLDSYQSKLDVMISENDGAVLKTQHDVRNDTLRTTVVAQKVLLSKHKAALSEQDKAYSELVAQFQDELDQYFNTTFIDPKELFLIEILMYDLKSPHTEVFQPKPRFAVERALAAPHDYLGCECCSGEGTRDGEAALFSTQPATAILYQLYVESGSVINAADLWSAFNAMAGGEEEDDESKTMALFQRALAELRYLGLVKPSRKKTDHVAKMMWKGL